MMSEPMKFRRYDQYRRTIKSAGIAMNPKKKNIKES